ncbi:MAG TPA: MXAN_6640 family putative metalloprotease [Solirubrobacteraceae bacterium]|jgi:hypothetical protein
MPLLALVVLIVLAFAPAASAAPSARARAQAERALEQVRDARGRELTPALRELFARRAALGAADRRAADRYFARPTDSDDRDGDRGVGAEYTVAEAPPVCSEQFCVHYVRTTADAPPLADGDGDGVPDYVQRMRDEFELVRGRENAELGWPEPPSDGTRGGDARLDIYVADLDPGYYGYASPDSQQPDGGSLHAYQVMDDDYAEFALPTVALQVTAAHEYNHVLQFGINPGLEGWMFEATATWMEEQVHPEADDYLQYIPGWARSAGVGVPLTTFQDDGSFQYGSAVWNHFLSAHYGPAVVRDAWTRSLDGEDSLSAYNRAIPTGPDDRAGSELGSFALALAEWRAPTRTFPDEERYTDVPRVATVSVDGPPITLTLDHASLALVDIAGRGTDTVAFEATFPSGDPAFVGIYGGPGPGGGDGPVGGGGAGGSGGAPHDVQQINPARYARLTGVVANTKRVHGARDPGSGEFDWSPSDRVPIVVRAFTYRGPSGGGAPVTPTPTPTPTPIAPTPPAPPADVTGPVVKIPSRNRSLRASSRGLVRFGLGPVSEAVRGVVSLRTAARVKVGGRRRVLVFGSRTFRALAGGRTTAKIRLGRTARRLLGARRKLRLTATVTARDAAGNLTTKTYRFTLRAPKRR